MFISHNFFAKLDPDVQATLPACSLEFCMLSDYTDRSKDIDTFVSDYADLITSGKIDVLKTAMDKFDKAFEEIKIPLTSIPMVLYSDYRIVKDKKSFPELFDLVNECLVDYENNEEYKKYIQSGTSASENIAGRLSFWKEKLNAIK